MAVSPTLNLVQKRKKISAKINRRRFRPGLIGHHSDLSQSKLVLRLDLITYRSRDTHEVLVAAVAHSSWSLRT